MMLRSDDDVLHSSRLGEGDDVVCAEAGRVGILGEGFVVGDGDGEVVHDPLADVRGALAVPFACRNGVEAPVDEHAEAGLAPPLHASVALGWGLCVLNRGDRVVDGLGVGLASFQLRVAHCSSGEDDGGDDAAAG